MIHTLVFQVCYWNLYAYLKCIWTLIQALCLESLQEQNFLAVLGFFPVRNTGTGLFLTISLLVARTKKYILQSKWNIINMLNTFLK